MQCGAIAAILLLSVVASDGLVQSGGRRSQWTQATSRPMLKKNFTIRYTLMDPNPVSDYVEKVGLPALASAHCTAEAYLAPALLAAEFIEVLPNYLIYTDHRTHPHAQSWVEKLPEVDRSRIHLVNLDEDPQDKFRLAPFSSVRLDAKNFVSIRRTLADGDHLPTDSSRLLLGTDVSFLANPVTFISEASKLSQGQAMYMSDDVSFRGQKYTMKFYDGPQCAGLLGDFIFLAPGVQLGVGLLQEKMRWYLEHPYNTEPPCDYCLRHMEAHPFHAIDQFAMVMALGEATAVDGSGGCIALPEPQFHSSGRCNESGYRDTAEVVHDKCKPSGSTCSYHGFMTRLE